MTWEQQLQAMQAISEVRISMRAPGNWFASWSFAEIGGDGMLASRAGDGASPKEAVESLWDIVTNLDHDRYIVVHAGSDRRRHVRWNGFMWDDIPRAA